MSKEANQCTNLPPRKWIKLKPAGWASPGKWMQAQEYQVEGGWALSSKLMDAVSKMGNPFRELANTQAMEADELYLQWNMRRIRDIFCALVCLNGSGNMKVTLLFFKVIHASSDVNSNLRISWDWEQQQSQQKTHTPRKWVSDLHKSITHLTVFPGNLPLIAKCPL